MATSSVDVWNDPEVRATLQACRHRQHSKRTILLRGLSEGFLVEDLALKLARSDAIDPRAFDDEGMTALHWAARRGYPEVLNVLLERGVPVQSQDHQGCSTFDHVMLQHLRTDQDGVEPPSMTEVALLRVLIKAGGRPEVIFHAPAPGVGLAFNQHMAYLNAWRGADGVLPALRRGIDAIRLAVEVDTVRPAPGGASPDDTVPWPVRARPRL